MLKVALTIEIAAIPYMQLQAAIRRRRKQMPLRKVQSFSPRQARRPILFKVCAPLDCRVKPSFFFKVCAFIFLFILLLLLVVLWLLANFIFCLDTLLIARSTKIFIVSLKSCLCLASFPGNEASLSY